MKSTLQETSQIVETVQVQSLLIGNRIPKDYFVTTGKGQSDITIHAGSYHLALKDAGIEMCNIMTYSSILPGIATPIQKPEKLTHGCVMESIMSVAHAEKGETATAGIIYGWLWNKETKEKFGGLVCEHSGNYSLEELMKRLRASLEELYYNGFSEEYDILSSNILSTTITATKKHATALAAICFTNYVFPVVQ